ncbi:hypothetical protein T484DRAFT_1902647, partial [Baffinella frigidus]
MVDGKVGAMVDGKVGAMVDGKYVRQGDPPIELGVASKIEVDDGNLFYFVTGGVDDGNLFYFVTGGVDDGNLFYFVTGGVLAPPRGIPRADEDKPLKEMVVEMLLGAPDRKMLVWEIVRTLRHRCPHLRSQPDGTWHATVRQCLTTYRCFAMERDAEHSSAGPKGCRWTLATIDGSDPPLTESEMQHLKEMQAQRPGGVMGASSQNARPTASLQQALAQR